MDKVLEFKQMVVWDKGPMGMGWHYRRSYETVLVAQKPGRKCRWFDTSHRIENVIRDIRKIIPSADDHPTPKPLALMQRFIQLHSRPGHLVLDPFMGAGVTGEACALSGRRFVGVELSARWFEKACRRIREAYRAKRAAAVA